MDNPTDGKISELISQYCNQGDYHRGFRNGVDATLCIMLDLLDKDVDLYKQIGKPDNQHRDVVNALGDFREQIVKLKGRLNHQEKQDNGTEVE